MLKDSQQHTNQLKKQLSQTNEESFIDNEGKITTKEKATVMVMEEDARIHGCLKDIRTLITQKLLPIISEKEFNEKAFEEYVKHIQQCLKEDGYELFPTEYQILPLR